jgi:hypothetical protein
MCSLKRNLVESWCERACLDFVNVKNFSSAMNCVLGEFQCLVAKGSLLPNLGKLFGGVVDGKF